MSERALLAVVGIQRIAMPADLFVAADDAVPLHLADLVQNGEAVSFADIVQCCHARIVRRLPPSRSHLSCAFRRLLAPQRGVVRLVLKHVPWYLKPTSANRKFAEAA